MRLYVAFAILVIAGVGALAGGILLGVLDGDWGLLILEGIVVTALAVLWAIREVIE